MFRKLASTAPRPNVTFIFDGRTLVAEEGMSVAAALFSHGINSLRKTPVSRSERGPFCMMGSCYDCLVSIDRLTVQACQVPVSEGLIVSRVDVTDYSKPTINKKSNDVLGV